MPRAPQPIHYANAYRAGDNMELTGAPMTASAAASPNEALLDSAVKRLGERLGTKLQFRRYEPNVVCKLPGGELQSAQTQFLEQPKAYVYHEGFLVRKQGLSIALSVAFLVSAADNSQIYFFRAFDKAKETLVGIPLPHATVKRMLADRAMHGMSLLAFVQSASELMGADKVRVTGAPIGEPEAPKSRAVVPEERRKELARLAPLDVPGDIARGLEELGLRKDRAALASLCHQILADPNTELTLRDLARLLGMVSARSVGASEPPATSAQSGSWWSWGRTPK